ncbi:MAG: cobyric acid synthase, partial [Pseudomonadota bacterium]
ATADLVLVEGAGSPAEVNLRAGDIANMGFARATETPVVLVGDIDRGGVIAQLVGTKAVLDPEDAALVRGFLINKFRGDPSLFDDGYRLIEERAGWPGFGVLPWFPEAGRLPGEDALDLPRRTGEGPFKIVCPQLSRIANFDDLDPLGATPGVSVEMIPPGRALPGDADLVLLPGSKSTRGDLAFLRAQGWDVDLFAHVRRGGRVLGICGGYQMLGRRIADPDGVEGPAGETEGLGLLDVETLMSSDKRLARVRGRDPESGLCFEGYEIHIGRTDGPDRARPWLEIETETETGAASGAASGTESGAETGPGWRPEGAISADGRVIGAYIHGLFGATGFRTEMLRRFGATAEPIDHAASIETTLDQLADHLEAHLDIDGLLALARIS